MLTLLIMAMTLGGVGAALEPTPAAAARKHPRQVAAEIIRGGEVADASYPFVATIGSAPQDVFCDGSLIAPSFVLTAAHCVVGEAAEHLVVVVGRTVLSSGAGEVRGVAAINIHPAYRDRAKSPPYDVAVLQLAQPITTIPPVTLVGTGDTSLEGAGASLTIAGWGSLDRYGQQVPDRMQAVQVTVVGDDPCDRQWKRRGREKGIQQALVVCTAQLHAGFGDSGGPVFATIGTTPVQVAVVNGSGPKDQPPDYHAQLSAPGIQGFVRSFIGP
jgi:secreted trypsin-like serine protease